MLIDLAPNDNWRRLYSLDLEREIQEAEESHNQSLHLTRARAAATQS
jgi:hypothetical protein